MEKTYQKLSSEILSQCMDLIGNKNETKYEQVQRAVRRSHLTKDCIEFVGSWTKGGYGHLKLPDERKNIRAHRLAFSLHMGRELKPHEMICHKCNNRRCLNITHLYIGDHQTNADDRGKRGRRYNGMLIENRIFSPEVVRAMRHLHFNLGRKKKAIAVLFETSEANCGQAINGRTYKDVI